MTEDVRGRSVELSIWLVYQSLYLDPYLFTIPYHPLKHWLIHGDPYPLLSDVLSRLFHMLIVTIVTGRL